MTGPRDDRVSATEMGALGADGAAFDGGMSRLSLDIIDEVLARYDFSAATRILDVGGGRGHFAAAVLEA